MHDKQRELASLWLGLAETDVAVARRLLPDLIDPAAFHVQQAVEKALKAAIVLSGGEPPKIHDLKRLCNLAQSGLSWTASEEWLGQITDWNAVTRYRVVDLLAGPTAQQVENSLASVDRLVAELRAKVR